MVLKVCFVCLLFRNSYADILKLRNILDFIIVGSDSGRIVVLEYDPATNSFNKLHQETYGRSGSRRIVPGQHIATDPKGRAVMIGAMEKSKLVYILNRVSIVKRLSNSQEDRANEIPMI